jgi:hypothetical protein
MWTQARRFSVMDEILREVEIVPRIATKTTTRTADETTTSIIVNPSRLREEKRSEKLDIRNLLLPEAQLTPRRINNASRIFKEERSDTLALKSILLH